MLTLTVHHKKLHRSNGTAIFGPSTNNNNTNTMNTNDNFDALWGQFRQQVAQARTKRDAVCTFGENEMYGGRVSLGDPEEYNGRQIVSLHTARGTWGGLMSCHKSDLIAIAAQCMAVAEEMEKAEPTPVPFDAMAHGHLVTERAPSDDEQP